MAARDKRALQQRRSKLGRPAAEREARESYIFHAVRGRNLQDLDLRVS